MINDKIEKALNKQINEELFSSYLYLSMSAFLSSLNLNGFASWMKVQSHEEYTHADRIYNYIHHQNGKVVLTGIESPKIGWASPLEIFNESLKHEKKITKLIHDLVDLATENKDYATISFLQWYVNEQVEEEASVIKIIEALKMVGDAKSGLYILDKEMMQRAKS
jgi:ferritin